MHYITFYNLGNADTSLIELSDGRHLLVDFADTSSGESDDNRCDLPVLLESKMNNAGKSNFEIVAFTHLDQDHLTGSQEFFWLEHAKKYQGDDRFKIDELWVPAAVITEEGLSTEVARIIQAEARHRLKNKSGIRVFSRPERLEAWLNSNGLSIDECRHLITDAGQLVPGFDKVADGIEFFIHSPHAVRLDQGGIEDRNGDCLVFQARFHVDGFDTDVLFTGDAKHQTWIDVVDITRYKGNEDRLHWNVYKLPHHCSYTAIGPEKSTNDSPNKTPPVSQVQWLCEEQNTQQCLVISSSNPIPDHGTAADEDVQPPHREAANYYLENVVGPKNGSFLVTMEEPSVLYPEPIVIEIGGSGALLKAAGASGFGSIVGGASPRAGALDEN